MVGYYAMFNYLGCGYLVNSGVSMVTKAEMKILEKAFVADMTNSYFQSKSRLAKKLVDDGYLEEVESKEMTKFGMMTVKHLVITIVGHMNYCMNCK